MCRVGWKYLHVYIYVCVFVTMCACIPVHMAYMCVHVTMYIFIWCACVQLGLAACSIPKQVMNYIAMARDDNSVSVCMHGAYIAGCGHCCENAICMYTCICAVY